MLFCPFSFFFKCAAMCTQKETIHFVRESVVLLSEFIYYVIEQNQHNRRFYFNKQHGTISFFPKNLLSYLNQSG